MGVGGVDDAEVVDGQTGRGGNGRKEGLDEGAARVELPDGVVPGIGDVNDVTPVDRKILRPVEEACTGNKGAEHG